MKNVAIIGMGKMGSKYAKMILTDKSLNLNLVASTRIRGKNLENVCDYLKAFSNNIVVASGEESLMSLYLSNAMYLSSWKSMPINIYDIASDKELEFEKEFEEEMNKKI